jgi:MtrB/PioB family decaheme-associated outer membrane protein
MKVRGELLLTCAAFLIGAGFVTQAKAADLVTPLLPAAPVEAWWYEGYAEIGGRFFFNNPDRSSLGKFYEYRDLRQGPFGNFYYGAHRTGPNPFEYDVWGTNVGWNDQSFGLDASRPGYDYFSFVWDETPHVYTQNAHSVWSGVGSTFLSANVFPGTLTVANGNALANTIANNSSLNDIEIRRDTATAAYRWTPTENWDVNADYSHMHRWGTQSNGTVSFSGAAGTRSAFETIKPIDDVTQNANLKAEYNGATPWGKTYNVAVGGAYSNYSDANSSYFFQNPWNAVTTPTSPLLNQYSTPPDNQAGSFNLTGAVGLPWNSRYMGTFQYTRLTADNPNLPISSNPFVLTMPGLTPYPTVGSLDRTNILSNNVVNTKWTSDLQSTLKYRYYQVDSGNSPSSWQDRPTNPDSTLAGLDEEGTTRYHANYTKQNADAQVDYRPWKWLNVGASYDWEHWNRDQREVGITNENTGKVFADLKPWSGSTLRGSLQYGQRRFDTYTALDTDSNIAQYRMKDLANRDLTKGVFQWAIEVIPAITVTPNGGFTIEDYRTDIEFFRVGEIGLKKADSWYAGVDASWAIIRDVSLFVSYNFDNGYRQTYENAAIPLANLESKDTTNTVVVGAKWVAIPQTLFFDLNYSLSQAKSAWSIGCTPAGCQYTPLAMYPDVHNNLNRLDFNAKYVFDDSFTRNWGFLSKTRAFVRGRVTWERNTNDSWQGLQNQLGFLVNPTVSTTGYSIWLATGNPNYDVVLGQVAFGVKW